MADEYSLTVAAAEELTAASLGECSRILKEGGAVNVQTAKVEIPIASVVAIARQGDAIVGLGVIKRMRPEYAADKSEKSGVPFDPQTAELGYVAVDKQHRGHGLSFRIADLLLSKDHATLFATTDSERMKSVLRKVGFERRGRQWPGKRGLLSLWIRDAARHELGEAKGLKGWIDYDREKLSTLTPQERITYFEWRVRRVVINPLERILAREILPTAESSALLIFGVSLCCAIEATGRFLTGGGDGTPLQAFLSRYMHASYESRKVGAETFGDVLRKHFRNGLAHGFSVSQGGFEGVAGQEYFRVASVAGREALEINPTSFFDDYAVGFERYLADVRSAQPDGPLFLAFDRVFTRTFIEGK
jgi:hypothetical protein